MPPFEASFFCPPRKNVNTMLNVVNGYLRRKQQEAGREIGREMKQAAERKYMQLIVTANKKDPTRGILVVNGAAYPCRLGRNGVTHDKKEGDGKTPLGNFILRAVWYRGDIYSAANMGKRTGLTRHEINHKSGWSDDPTDTAYNRAVTLPHNFHHEKLWRDDRLYHLLIPLGYNDAPPIAGKGSAIFFHLTAEDDRPTDGCVAIAPEIMLRLLPLLDAETEMMIRLDI